MDCMGLCSHTQEHLETLKYYYKKHTKLIFMKAHYEIFQSKNYADLLYI